MKKVLGPRIYTIIFIILLSIFWSLSAYILYNILPIIREYGTKNNIYDLANFFALSMTMLLFVLDYIITLLIMNVFFCLDRKKRYGVQNRLIVFSFVITIGIFLAAYFNFGLFKEIASHLFYIRYFPKSYVYLLIPLFLIPNFIMLIHVDKYMLLSIEEQVNLNSTIINNAPKEEPTDIWSYEKQEEVIKSTAEIFAENKEIKEELSPISIKDSITNELEEKKVKEEELINNINQGMKTLENGAPVFNGLESMQINNYIISESNPKEETKVTTSNIHANYVRPEGADISVFDPPNIKEETKKEETNYKNCPICNMQLKDDVKICFMCGHNFE